MALYKIVVAISCRRRNEQSTKWSWCDSDVGPLSDDDRRRNNCDEMIVDEMIFD